MQVHRNTCTRTEAEIEAKIDLNTDTDKDRGTEIVQTQTQTQMWRRLHRYTTLASVQRYGINHMVNSVPLDRCQSSIPVKASPQKYISWDAGYFGPDNSDRPGYVPNSSSHLW